MIDFGTVRVAQRPLLARAPVHADDPAPAVVGAVDVRQAIVALRAVGRAGRQAGGGVLAADDGAEVDGLRQGHVRVLVDQAGADREAVAQLERCGQGQVDDLHVRFQRVVATLPAGVVLGLQAERRADHRAQRQVLEVPAQRQDEGRGRHGGHVTGVAAVAAGQRLLERRAGGGGAVTGEGVGQVDRGDVGLQRALGEGRHDGRVVDHDRSVALGGGRTGHRAALRLDAVFLQLEGGGMHVAVGQHARNAEGQRGNAGQVLGEFHQ